MRKTSQARYALVLTGNCHAGQYRVQVKGRAVWLTPVHFEALCDLVAARGRGDGVLLVSRVVVHRIRQAIGDARLASEMFERGRAKHYRIAWPCRQIAADKTFFQLPSPEVLGPDIQRIIRRNCDVITIK